MTKNPGSAGEMKKIFLALCGIRACPERILGMTSRAAVAAVGACPDPAERERDRWNFLVESAN